MKNVPINDYQLPSVQLPATINYQININFSWISFKKYEQDLYRETDMGSWTKGERGKDKVRKDNLNHLIIRERAEVGDIEENL